MWILFFLFLLTVFARADSEDLFGSRIISGHDTNITEVPWQLLHLMNGTLACGGVIIGPREVLTAGHCYYGLDESYIHQYRAGSSNKNDGGIIYDVEHYVIHPDFVMTDNYIYHDITFVRMKRPFSFSEYIQPIKLADKEPEEGAEALISGWGAIKRENTSMEFPDILQSVKLPVIGREKCAEWYSDYIYGEVKDDQICVGAYEGGVGACTYDSGGPMVVNKELVGLASWTEPCAKPHHPTVYTSIPYYRDWIQQQTESNN